MIDSPKKFYQLVGNNGDKETFYEINSEDKWFQYVAL